MWSETRVVERGMTFPDNFTGAMVNGALVDLEPGTPFVAAVMDVARDAGLGKFRVYLNGEEIDPEGNLPDFVEEGFHLKVTAYDDAGSAA